MPDNHEAAARGWRCVWTDCPLSAPARSPQDEDHEAVRAILNRIIDAASQAGADGVLPAETVRVECLRATYALGAARSPQDEDSISPALKAATQALCRHENAGCLPNVIDAARDVVDAYLSRVSPSPERDTEKP